LELKFVPFYQLHYIGREGVKGEEGRSGKLGVVGGEKDGPFSSRGKTAPDRGGS